MIDNRINKIQHDEIDAELMNLSDTEILLEFSKLLNSIYPHLIKTKNHCYDPYDDISENLFFDFVYSTFSGKYGAIINRNEIHKYGFSLQCYKNLTHIRIIPKKFPFLFEDQFGQQTIGAANELENKELVFILFGDKKNYLSGDCEQVQIDTVNFDFVNFAFIDKNSGFIDANQISSWIDKNLVDFELVLEDLDQSGH